MPAIGTDVSGSFPGICNDGPDPHRCNVSPQPDPDAAAVSDNPPHRNAAETPDPSPGMESCGVAAETGGPGETEGGDDEGPIPDFVF